MANLYEYLSEFIDFMEKEHKFDVHQMFELSNEELKPYYDDFLKKKLAEE